MSKVEIENRCWIAGEFTHGTGRSFDIVNPATLDKTTTVHGASEADINRAVEAAKAAQPAWANAPAGTSTSHTPAGGTDMAQTDSTATCAPPTEFRAQCLNKWADLLVEHADTLAYVSVPAHVARCQADIACSMWRSSTLWPWGDQSARRRCTPRSPLAAVATTPVSPRQSRVTRRCSAPATSTSRSASLTVSLPPSFLVSAVPRTLVTGSIGLNMTAGNVPLIMASRLGTASAAVRLTSASAAHGQDRSCRRSRQRDRP